MGLQSLVLSNDAEVLRQLRLILNDLGVGSQVCSRPEQVLEELTHSKFELVVLDSESAPANMLTTLRNTRSNRTTIVCAIGTPSTSQPPFDLMLARPFAIADAWRTLREARSLMEQELQRYYREQVELPVVVRWHHGGCIETHGCNLSVSGIAVSTALPQRTCVTVSFALESQTVEFGGEVTWTKEGRSGVHFVNLPDTAKQRLESWIAERRHEHEYSFVRPFPEERKPSSQPFAD